MSVMIKNNLTIFANFFIDNEERFLRMKDSLHSMKEIRVQKYVINVRGSYSEKAIEYLRNNVELLHISSAESDLGWFHDTSKIMHLIESSYVLCWIEDHICMHPEAVNNVVEDMTVCNADILTYSFWCNGKFLERYSHYPQFNFGNISWFDHEEKNNKIIQNNSLGRDNYLISYASIIKTTLFKNIILNSSNENRWPLNTPFDFEKAPEDIHWLPLRRANPKKELFASIDDDLHEPGSSLQARGLYPKRISRQSYANIENIFSKLFIKYMKIKLISLKTYFKI
jgi:hypothetical protein